VIKKWNINYQDKMISAIVRGPSLQDAKKQICLGNAQAKYLEFRLDRFSFFKLKMIQALRESAEIPVIFTLRRSDQGGGWMGVEQSRLEKLVELATLEPDFIDVELGTDPSIYEKIQSRAPNIRILASYHHFSATPTDLESIYEKMQNPYISCFKIVSMANSLLDSLKMLRFLQKNQNGRLTAFCMGPHGQLTRILAPIYGGHMTYASLSKRDAICGQLDIETLQQVYHYDRLNPHTKVLGLIGDPVSKSPSHYTHNQTIREIGIDAVYVKMCAGTGDIAVLLPLLKELNVYGLSVTMPLKEMAFNFVDIVCPLARQIGSVNTLLFKKNTILATNTDGVGALDAIEQKIQVKEKKFVIIGAGGAAKAIALEAKRRKAHLFLLNRTPEKAARLAARLSCYSGGFSQYPQIAAKGYDVLVNATPLGLYGEQLPFAHDLLAKKVVMDVVHTPLETPFLLAAKKKACTLVYGKEMFKRQAKKQFQFWFE